MTIEDILDETGGFGRFQLFIVLCVCLNRFTIGWSMLQMCFAGLTPEWFCLNVSSADSQNESFVTCSFNISSETQSPDVANCDKYQFDDPPLTIINEWNLLCGLGWVKATVTSMQMAGVLVGVILAGYLGDCMGRKKTMYLFVLEHAVLNIITAFSVNWQMFAVCRFFIGLGIGVILVSSFPYPLEFLPIKWRPLVAALPVWSFGICVFALAGWLMENWSHLHVACGVLSLPGLLGYFYVPESLKWLTVHDHMKEAQDVVTKIAVLNQRVQPRKASIMLQAVAWEEQKARESNKKHTYKDIFKEWQTAKSTLIFSYHWFSLSLVYYGICFSISSLEGNIYINIFLLAVVELPGMFVNFFSDIKIGRKWSCVLSLAIACLAVFACVLVYYCGPGHSKDSITTGLCLTVKLGAGTAWAIVETWGIELHPTATRNHSFGTANIAARVGALIAPFLVDLDNMAVASFIVIGCLLLIDIILCIVTPETKRRNRAHFSANISVPNDPQTHSVDMNAVPEIGNESSTDTCECPEIGNESSPCTQSKDSTEVGHGVLGTINEENYTDEVDKTDTKREDTDDVNTKDVSLSLDPTDKEVTVQNIGDTTSDVANKNVIAKNDTSKDKSVAKDKGASRDKIASKDKKKEPKTEKAVKNPSPKENSETKTRKDKLEKFKNKKSKTTPKDESPPYIESQYHRNIRYSIY